jgi:hypothetical protein
VQVRRVMAWPSKRVIGVLAAAVAELVSSFSDFQNQTTQPFAPAGIDDLELANATAWPRGAGELVSSFSDFQNQAVRPFPPAGLRFLAVVGRDMYVCIL